MALMRAASQRLMARPATPQAAAAGVMPSATQVANSRGSRPLSGFSGALRIEVAIGVNRLTMSSSAASSEG